MNATSPGASGKFPVTKDITNYTMVKIFGKVGKKTGCFIRFPTVADEHGNVHAECDIPVSAKMFSTGEGNWDPVRQ